MFATLNTYARWIGACLMPLMFFAHSNEVFAQWQAADARLMTQWGHQVTPENAWREYPRPQMARPAWQNLNGLWEYAIAPRTAAAPESYEGRILVPFAVESPLSGVGKRLSPDERLWYRRTFELPSDWQDERVLLHFGAVDWDATVWVNGGLVGSHRGGYDPFQMDVTDFLNTLGKQEIVVSVWDPTSSNDQPRGKQRIGKGRIWYTPSSGIWQTVWLEPVPKEASIGEIRIKPDVDAGAVHVTVLGLYPHNSDEYAVRVLVLGNGALIAESHHRLDRTQTLEISNAKLWSPEHPFLYDLDVELYKVADPTPSGRIPKRGQQEQALYEIPASAELLDEVDSYFGMREVSVEPGPDGFPMLTLNNERIFQYGTLDQGYWPDGLVTPPSDEAMRYDMDFLKDAGFNMVRKHLKVEPGRYYYYADRIGLLIWQDMPSGMMANDKPQEGVSTEQFVRADDEDELVRRAASAAQFELELRRMIDALYNHPSIVMWIIHNEGWGQYDTERLAAYVADYDSSRLVNAASGWRDQPVGDIIDQHTYSVSLWDRERDGLLNFLPDPARKRAAVVGEFGGIGLPIHGHLWDSSATFGYQTYETEDELLEQYRHRLDQIREAQTTHAIRAAVYTQTTDIEGEVNGLMTYDREVKKLKPAMLRKLHRPLYGQTSD